jgi:hypothetical protein
VLIYFDMCCLQRPTDDQSQARIALETRAILSLLSVCRTGRHEFVNTGALEYEAGRNPDPVRRAHAQGILQEARMRIYLTDVIEMTAKVNESNGFKPLDALHLAFAVEGHVDYFCTCDDRFLRKVKGLNLTRPKVVTPVDLLAEVEHERGD